MAPPAELDRDLGVQHLVKKQPQRERAACSRSWAA
jgi:hypothetical protein